MTKKQNLGVEDLNLGHKKYALCKLGNISYRNYKPSHVHVLDSIVYIPSHFWVFKAHPLVGVFIMSKKPDGLSGV